MSFSYRRLGTRTVVKTLISTGSLWLLLAAMGTNQAQAADIEAVKQKVRMLCANCHGYDGVASLPGAANLSGQQEIYLKQQLKAYRSGERQNPMMTVVAKSLSDDDIDHLSAWYANIKVTVEPPPQ